MSDLVPVKSLLEYVPKLLEKDPALAKDVIDLNHYLTSAMVLAAYMQDEEDEERRQKRKKRRREWVRPYLRRRVAQGHYENLMHELCGEEKEMYKNFLRLDEQLFNEIVERVRPHIERATTNFRDPLEVGLRVAITLRFLATGNSYKSIGYSFRVAPNTISSIVPETCRAIIEEYGKDVIKTPGTPQEWKKVAKGFEEKWHFPHVIGAIDGKHVRIRNPYFSGSVYFNYKRYFSLVLLALVDAQYNFLYIDVGAVGAESDAGIFSQTGLADMFTRMQANLPPPEPLPRDPNGRPVEYFMVGDDAFGLRQWMMKPYPSKGLTLEERIFNYRLSRARRVVENAFGILAAR